MRKKIIIALLISVLLALSMVLLSGCGETRLDYPKNLDIIDEEDGTHRFIWDKVDGASGYLIYFNDDLSERFYLEDNSLPMNDAEITNYLKSGETNTVNIRAVNLDKNKLPVNESLSSVIVFNYSKKLSAPTRVKTEDNVITWKMVSEAKNYKAIIYDAKDSKDGKTYELDWSSTTTGISGVVKDIEDGEYFVSIIASGDSYEDSEPSDRVEYTYISEENLIYWNVGFDLNYEGSEPTVVKVVNKHKVEAPAAPSREGYNFLGWYEDKYCMIKADFDKTLIYGPTTFYAKYEEITHWPVRFDPNYEGGEIYTVDVSKNDTAIAPVIERSGYVLTDWFLDAECTEIAELDKLPVTGEITFYAKWNKLWNVTFDPNHDKLAAIIVETEDGMSATAPELVRNGYEFTGWYLDEVGFEKVDLESFKVTDDIRLYAGWIAVEKDYHFDADGDGYCDYCLDHRGEKVAVGEYEHGEDTVGELIKTVTVNVSGITWFENDGAQIYIYAWYDDSTENAAFPGIKMSGSAGTYTIEMNVYELAGVVISRVSPEGELWNQTDNITDFGADYVISITEGDIKE